MEFLRRQAQKAKDLMENQARMAHTQNVRVEARINQEFRAFQEDLPHKIPKR
jgi:hypothetical protein